ncbi:IS66 family transposase [Dehalococcoidia bacterium]|nr:IS66 family transposase [Dehalococcoidia bacterium]
MGTVDNCVHEVGEAVEEPVNALKEQLPQQDKLNIDETGWKKAGKRRWLWTFVAPNFTFFQIAQSRGKKVLEEILGQFFPGIITSDRLRSYRSYQMAGWQICLAHLIREAKGLSQSDDPATSRFGYWIRRELKLASLWKKGKAKSLEMNACKARLRRACLLNQDREDKHVRNLARAILKDWEAVTLFTRVEDISPTNNVAEQSLRSLVIARKICFGNHSEKGLVTTARLRTVVATARMRGVDVWDYLAHALVHYRSGQPVPLLDLSSGWTVTLLDIVFALALQELFGVPMGDDLGPSGLEDVGAEDMIGMVLSKDDPLDGLAGCRCFDKPQDCQGRRVSPSGINDDDTFFCDHKPCVNSYRVCQIQDGVHVVGQSHV